MAKFCEGCGHPLEDNAQFCDKCGRKAGIKCLKCGTALAPGESFCRKCGTKAGAAASQPQQPPSPQAPRPAAYTAPQPPQPQARPAQAAQPQPPRPAAPAYAPQPPKKSRAGLFIGLGALALLIILGVVFGGSALMAFANKPVELIPFPEGLKVSGEVKPNCTYTSPEYIIPANYRSMDNIVFMTCWTDTGKTRLMVSVEIPGFTQKYEQLIDVSRAETELSIHPPLLADAAKGLNSSKDAELVVTVKDENTGKTIVQDTKPVKLYSRNDIQWASADGTPYDENILAWVTPEAKQIDEMLRDTADSLNYLTNGTVNSIVGYQQISDWSHNDITYAQVVSMMYTLAKTYNVKYIMAPFSATSADLQSVKTPAQVIDNRAGLCVETVVTMASAIQRTNMHAVIILLPGHAQVAVETWNNSGEYLLIETTALDATRAGKFDSVVTYMTKDQWRQYMAQEGYTAIDCALAEQLNIQSID